MADRITRACGGNPAKICRGLFHLGTASPLMLLPHPWPYHDGDTGGFFKHEEAWWSVPQNNDPSFDFRPTEFVRGAISQNGLSVTMSTPGFQELSSGARLALVPIKCGFDASFILPAGSVRTRQLFVDLEGFDIVPTNDPAEAVEDAVEKEGRYWRSGTSSLVSGAACGCDLFFTRFYDSDDKMVMATAKLEKVIVCHFEEADSPAGPRIVWERKDDFAASAKIVQDWYASKITVRAWIQGRGLPASATIKLRLE